MLTFHFSHMCGTGLMWTQRAAVAFLRAVSALPRCPGVRLIIRTLTGEGAASITVAIGRAASITVAIGRAASITVAMGRAASITVAIGRAASITVAIRRAASITVAIRRAASITVAIGRAASNGFGLWYWEVSPL